VGGQAVGDRLDCAGGVCVRGGGVDVGVLGVVLIAGRCQERGLGGSSWQL